MSERPKKRAKLLSKETIQALEQEISDLIQKCRDSHHELEVKSLTALICRKAGELQEAKYMLHSKDFSKLTPEDVYDQFGIGPKLSSIKSLDFSARQQLQNHSPLKPVVQWICESWKFQLRHSPDFVDLRDAPRTWLIKDVLFRSVDHFVSTRPNRKIIVEGEGRIRGEYAQDPVEFVIKEQNSVMLIIVAKKDNFAQGKARALMGMHAISERSKNKNVFGIVSNAGTWYPYMLQVEEKQFYRGKSITTDPSGAYDGNVENMHKVVELILYMLDNINTDVDVSE